MNIPDMIRKMHSKIEALSNPKAPAEPALIYPLGHEKNKHNIESNGKFARTREVPRVLVLHWGSHSADQLAQYFRTTDRAVSAHWAVDETGAYQMLDHRLRAYHAGWINTFSIGMDITMQPPVGNADRYRRAGRLVEIIDNPTRRGERKILKLDPRIAKNMRDLVFELCKEFNIPLEVPRDAAGRVRHDVVFSDAKQLGGFSGVLGHHHVDSRKWDVAPYWEDIFGGTDLGDK
jgi:hypothetical protein